MAHPQFTCAVQVEYLSEQSDPANGPWAYAYTITITNSGDVTAQLVARRWTVVDANGLVEEVRGLAVVGHQPVLKPGEEFRYTSWTRIATPQGTMKGTFLCVTEHAEPFESEVPEFLLGRGSDLH